MKIRTTLFGLILLLAGAFQGANAALLYDEGVSGDLSGDNLSPTALMALAAGSNVVTGGALSSPLDRDIFTVTVGAGQQLVGIVLDTSLTMEGNKLTNAKKAAIEFLLKNAEASKEALTDMPPRSEEELDAVSLHNQVIKL